MKKSTKLLCVFCLFAPFFYYGQVKDKSYKDGKELISAMYQAYAPNKWYRYFTFSQDMDFYRNDSIIKREVWHEAYQPGALVIKIGSKDSKNGRLYTNFAVHSFTDGKETQVTPRVHELLLVGLDVYFFKPERTVQLLDSLGYNLSKIRTDEYKGRKVYVVGADKGDENSRQFWIDAERLYMHRIISNQKGKISDVEFGEYVNLEGYWIAKTITFKVDGKLNLIERYYDIKFPKSLKPELFDPKKFGELVME